MSVIEGLKRQLKRNCRKSFFCVGVIERRRKKVGRRYHSKKERNRLVDQTKKEIR